jgi:hypothetical protein
MITLVNGDIKGAPTPSNLDDHSNILKYTQTFRS